MTDGDLLLRSARTAVQGHDWTGALDAFIAAAAVAPLSGEELEAMAEAAYWASRPQEALDASHRAYAAYLDADRAGEAASAALLAARLHFVHGEMAVATGWADRARRLLEDAVECSAHAMLAWADGQIMMLLKGHDQALERAQEVEAIASRLGDRDLVALGRAMQGFIRIHSGDVDAGMALLSEATAGAVAGELGPFATAEIMCEMVVSCLDVADFERAAEWLDTAERAGRDIVCFPGCCRTHRATLHRHCGEWPEAEREARQAHAEVVGIEILHEGMNLTELGELYRYKGQLALAQKAFDEAYEKGWPPQPGMALVLLARGDTSGAEAMIARAVDRCVDEPAALIHLLPAQVEVALASGNLEVVSAAAAALRQATSALRTSAAIAANAAVEGLIRQAQGDLTGAASQFEQSVRSWQKARSPYNVAQSRMRLGGVLFAAGDVASARIEWAAAGATFDRLGAVPESAEVAMRLGQDRPQRSSNTFMFTDIVNSTSLLTAIGDDAWHAVRLWHDRTICELVSEHTGRVVKETGDGFFIVFADPLLALDCAVAIQRALASHRRTDGFSPALRIGLHSGSAITIDGDDFAGRDVVVAARISASAGADEILISADVAGQLPDDVRIGPGVETILKGIPTPVGVAAVDWR
jgi:class 3 adenylate cyclase